MALDHVGFRVLSAVGLTGWDAQVVLILENFLVEVHCGQMLRQLTIQVGWLPPWHGEASAISWAPGLGDWGGEASCHSQVRHC